MFSFLVRLKRRIRKLLRVRSESRQRLVPTVRSRVIKIWLLIIMSLLVGILYPGEQLYDPADMPRKGEVAPYDIIAPYQLIVPKTGQEIQQDRKNEILAIPYIVEEDTAASRRVISDLGGFFDLVDSLRQVTDTPLAEIQPALEQIAAEHYPYVNRDAILASLQ